MLCLPWESRLTKKWKTTLGRKSRNKGKVGEREAVNKICKEMWGCTDAARTSQTRGDLTPDIDIGLPIHVEVKRHARIASIRFLEQAEKDSHGLQPEMVLMREDNDTEWIFMCRCKNLEQITNGIFRGKDTTVDQ